MTLENAFWFLSGQIIGLAAVFLISNHEYRWHQKFKTELFDKLEDLKTKVEKNKNVNK